jgi:hypothetical protein
MKEAFVHITGEMIITGVIAFSAEFSGIINLVLN